MFLSLAKNMQGKTYLSLYNYCTIYDSTRLVEYILSSSQLTIVYNMAAPEVQLPMVCGNYFLLLPVLATWWWAGSGHTVVCVQSTGEQTLSRTSVNIQDNTVNLWTVMNKNQMLILTFSINTLCTNEWSGGRDKNVKIKRLIFINYSLYSHLTTNNHKHY